MTVIGLFINGQPGSWIWNHPQSAFEWMERNWANIVLNYLVGTSNIVGVGECCSPFKWVSTRDRKLDFDIIQLLSKLLSVLTFRSALQNVWLCVQIYHFYSLVTSLLHSYIWVNAGLEWSCVAKFSWRWLQEQIMCNVLRNARTDSNFENGCNVLLSTLIPHGHGLQDQRGGLLAVIFIRTLLVKGWSRGNDMWNGG